MGQHNIEDDFKKKLNQREITPSAASWDRLDAMLTVAEGKKQKRGFGWLYIAASILGFILITTAYFTQSQEMVDAGRENVVLEDKAPESTQQTKTPVETVVTHKQQSVAVTPIKKGNISKKQSSIAPEVQPENQSQIAQQTIINQKNEQVITVKKPTYVNVDELLASVEKEGKTKLTFPGKEKVKVNAGTLLSQVDGELDLTFREKALRSISRQYQKVNVALSNRNNE